LASLKCDTYFQIYEELFNQYVGKEITFVEVGVLHGGSLLMWRKYFGPQARIIGVDLDPKAKELEDKGFEIFIGSQSDSNFWKNFYSQVGNIDILFGSWAGAVGNFQFMPSTIKNYALDYDQNNIIELKKFEDSFASAANYINKIGWKKNTPCFYKIKLKKNIPTKYLNKSAKKLLHKKKLNDFKKYIVNFNEIDTDGNLQVAIITPDGDIVENINSNLSPAYIVFDNYELILKWNRSLRFALAVCTLKDKIKNEI
jgi:hypothetical protein